MSIDWVIGTGLFFAIVVFVELVRLDRQLLRVLQQEPKMARDSREGRSAELPLLSVIVTAKDEEQYVEATVRSLLTSSYPFLEILLVDDRSRDRTGELMEHLARQDPRVSVLHLTELPPGWTGKTHAMCQAAERASADILLFTDADTVFTVDTVSRSVEFFLRNNVDMLSLLPGFVDRGFFEDAVHIHMALGLSYFYPLDRVNDRTDSAGLASGCFIMIKKQVYEEIGTWKRFRHDLTEDVALGKAVKAEGKKLIVMRAGEMVRTRPFKNMKEVCSFWKRTFYGGLEKNPAKILRLCMNYIALTFLFALFIVSGVVCFKGGAAPTTSLLFVFTAVDTAAVLVPLAVFIRMEHGYWPHALASPFGVLVGAWICLITVVAVLTGTGIYWRGSRYT